MPATLGFVYIPVITALTVAVRLCNRSRSTTLHQPLFVQVCSPPQPLLFPSPFLYHVLTFIALTYSKMARDRLAAMRVRLITCFSLFNNELGEGSTIPGQPIVG